MGLILKSENKIDVTGLYIYMKDVTGVFDIIDNVGGWGGDNPSRNEIALIFIIEKERQDEASILLVPTPEGSDISYDATFLDSEETEVTFVPSTDGVHNHYLIALLAINESQVLLPSPGDYYYATDKIGIFIRGTGLYGDDLPIQSKQELIDDDGSHIVARNVHYEFWTPKLSIKESQLYNEYRTARLNCDNEDAILHETLELNLNIEHAMGLFNLGLYKEAESVINTQLDLYNL